MNESVLVRLFSLYVFLIGLLGLYRTGSWVPVFISTAIAALTLLMLWMSRRSVLSGTWLLGGWLVICLFLFLASAFDLIGGHTNPQPGYRWIFFSEAAFALVALYTVIKK